MERLTFLAAAQTMSALSRRLQKAVLDLARLQTVMQTTAIDSFSPSPIGRFQQRRTAIAGPLPQVTLHQNGQLVQIVGQHCELCHWRNKAARPLLRSGSKIGVWSCGQMCSRSGLGNHPFVQGACMEFADRVPKCVDCGSGFVFAADEQFFFHDKKFVNDPKHCKQCLVKRAREPANSPGNANQVFPVRRRDGCSIQSDAGKAGTLQSLLQSAGYSGRLSAQPCRDAYYPFLLTFSGKQGRRDPNESNSDF